MSAVDNSPLPEGVLRTTVDIPGGPLAVLDTGTPERGTVVMVPGFTGSKEDFRLLVKPVADAGFRVVAIDQRGQHESDGPDDEAAYGVEVLGSDLLHVVKALGDGPVHLVGHSFGGLVGRAAVLQEPSAFRSFVLMGSGPAALTGGRADVMPFMRAILLEGGVHAVWEASLQLPPRSDKPPVSDDVLAFLKDRMLGNTPASLLGTGQALITEPDRVAELKATGIRCHVMFGEQDDAWSPETQTEMAERLGCGVSVIEGAWHSPAAENPPATAAALLAFLTA
ncbi:MAG: Lysophospholipase [Frankiales bacterium]|nr:Lysophospholipase [Frankiales bacterium]